MTISNRDALWEAYIRDFKKAYLDKDFDKAQRILECAYSDAEDFAEIDFRLVSSTHCLASSYAQVNRERDAAELFLKFIELREKVLGPEDPDVADSLEKIAILQLSAQRKNVLKQAM